MATMTTKEIEQEIERTKKALVRTRKQRVRMTQVYNDEIYAKEMKLYEKKLKLHEDGEKAKKVLRRNEKEKNDNNASKFSDSHNVKLYRDQLAKCLHLAMILEKQSELISKSSSQEIYSYLFEIRRKMKEGINHVQVISRKIKVENALCRNELEGAYKKTIILQDEMIAVLRQEEEEEEDEEEEASLLDEVDEALCQSGKARRAMFTLPSYVEQEMRIRDDYSTCDSSTGSLSTISSTSFCRSPGSSKSSPSRRAIEHSKRRKRELEDIRLRMTTIQLD